MTGEEAIKTLKENCCAMCAYASHDMDSCDIRGCDNRDAIKVLEQEPCTDAISREELLRAIDTWDKFGYTETGCFVREPKVPYIHCDDVINCIKGMPPVKPQYTDAEIQKAYEIGKAENIDMLDRIRAEIEEYRDAMPWENKSLVKWETINYILEQIIDKYKASLKEDDKCQECQKDWTKCTTCPVMMKWVKKYKEEWE